MRDEIRITIAEALDKIWQKYALDSDDPNDASAIIAWAINASKLNSTIQTSNLTREDCQDIYKRFSEMP